MSRFIGIAFSQTDPRTYPSLAPTFLSFKNALDNSPITPPPITQLGTEGIYGFTYTASVPTYFLLDGITVNATTDRYVFGIIDPFHQVDEQLTAVSSTLQALGNTNVALGTTNVALGTSNIALGTTNVALGTSNIALGTTAVAIGTTIISIATFSATNSAEILLRLGSTASSFGDTVLDPTDVFGFLKRAQEFREGDQTFNKVSGAWSISARNSTLLVTKTLGNSSTEVTKT